MIKIIDIKKIEFQVPEPLSLDYVKEHLNIASATTDYDEKLEKLIPVCRRAIEDYCNISIIGKRIVLIADTPINDDLPYGPVTGIEGVFGADSSIGSGMPNYTTKESGWWNEGDRFSELNFGFDPMFPDNHYSRFYSYRNGITKIQYTVGMSVIPEPLIQGILEEIAFRFTHIGDEHPAVITEEHAKLTVKHYRKLWL